MLTTAAFWLLEVRYHEKMREHMAEHEAANELICLCYLAIGVVCDIPVVPGQAGGGSFQKEKNYIAQKESAYRMCKATDQRDAQIISLL